MLIYFLSHSQPTLSGLVPGEFCWVLSILLQDSDLSCLVVIAEYIYIHTVDASNFRVYCSSVQSVSITCALLRSLITYYSHTGKRKHDCEYENNLVSSHLWWLCVLSCLIFWHLFAYRALWLEMTSSLKRGVYKHCCKLLHFLWS